GGADASVAAARDADVLRRADAERRGEAVGVGAILAARERGAVCEAAGERGDGGDEEAAVRHRVRHPARGARRVLEERDRRRGEGVAHGAASVGLWLAAVMSGIVAAVAAAVGPGVVAARAGAAPAPAPGPGRGGGRDPG